MSRLLWLCCVDKTCKGTLKSLPYINFNGIIFKMSGYSLYKHLSSLMAMSLDVPLMGYIPGISRFIRFARASSHVTDFNNRNKFLTAKLLKQGYRYHKLRKAFSKFYRRHFELIEKYHVGLKNLCNNVFAIQNSMEIWYIN